MVYVKEVKRNDRPVVEVKTKETPKKRNTKTK